MFKLSNATNVEAAKVEHNKNMLQNAAKELSVQLDCGMEVCELRLIIGLSPSIKDLDKAAEVMKDVVDNIAKVIKDMPDLPVADVEEQQDKPAEDSEKKPLEIMADEFFNKFTEKFPYGAISMIMLDQDNNDCIVCGNLPKPIAGILLLESHE